MSVAAATIETTLTTQISIALRSLRTDGLGNSASHNINTAPDSKLSYEDGSASGMVHWVHAQRFTLTPSSGTYDLDLSTLLDPFGNNTGFGTIRVLYVKNRAASGGGQLLIGGATSNPWVAPFAGSGTPSTCKLTLNPGGEWFLSGPYTGYVVGSGSKNLRFTHNGGSTGSISGDLIVVGHS